MKLLLDTHTFIWLDTAPEKLSPAALVACQDSGNTLYLSVVSVWEMQIKLQLGKLKLDVSLEAMIQIQQDSNAMQILPIELRHVLALQHLPLHHNDPFDRLLVAQAHAENARLVTSDRALEKYAEHALLLWC